MVCAMEAYDHQKHRGKGEHNGRPLEHEKRHDSMRGCCRNTIISFKCNRVQLHLKKEV